MNIFYTNLISSIHELCEIYRSLCSQLKCLILNAYDTKYIKTQRDKGGILTLYYRNDYILNDNIPNLERAL